MYQAPIIALLMGVSAVWNSLGQSLERKGVAIPLFCHHYGFMYAMLTWLFGFACQSMLDDVMTPSNWLDDEATERFAIGVMQQNNEYNPDDPHGAYQTWKHEATLTDYPKLKEFSMLCPLWVALTLLVCIWHTHQHINKIRANRVDSPGGAKGRLCDCPQHNQTMTVLILPCVYGLLSFKSTQRIWQVMINHIPVPMAHHNVSAVAFHGYDERKTFLLEMYEANFMVGDIYETIALVTFGNLVMGVLKKKIDKMKVVFETKTKDMPDGDEMKQYIERLVDSMKTLTVAGVKLFAMSCMLQGVYTLVITTAAFDFPDFMPHLFSRDADNPGMFQEETMKATVHNFFLGAGFIASFAAIGNIMIIEEDFEELLHEFCPSYKFWGTKILVSLAFLQSILISLFLTPAGWSEIQSNLMYSSMLCLECLLIALFHIKGWSADEVWYGDYEMKRMSVAGLEKPLLGKNVPLENK
jgi:hypothetical protein